MSKPVHIHSNRHRYYGSRNKVRGIGLVQDICKRCSKPIMTATRSFYGHDDLKAKYGSICETCMTPEELRDLLLAQGQRLAGRTA